MHYRQGFTLIEAIVVVAIIGLLTAGAALSLREYRVRAEATATAQELVELETAFTAYRQFELSSTGWPVHGTLNNDSDLFTIVSGGSSHFPNFDQYYNGNPELLQGYEVDYYQRAGASYVDSCSGQGYSSGVNIRIHPNTRTAAELAELFIRLNQVIDNDDPVLDCGKIRTGGPSNAVYFNIASSTFGY